MKGTNHGNSLLLQKESHLLGLNGVFKTKLNERRNIEKYKARLVAKGYAEQYGINYTEVFALVARLNKVQILLALATHHRWEVFKLDVKSVFLHGELKEEVYIQQPKGFVKKGQEDKIYRLRKALYGLKQALRARYNRIEAYFAKENFEKCPSEHTLFTKKNTHNILIINFT